MKIHVPIHLRKIEVIDQMCKMIEEYGENFYIDTTDSFENYYYYLKLDPVKRFLNLCISKCLSDLSYFMAKTSYSPEESGRTLYWSIVLL